MRPQAHGHGYTDLNFLIPELIDRIDYKKGTYFADEGDFASAGSARIHIADKLKQGVAALTLGDGKERYARAVLASSSAVGSGNVLYGLALAHDDGPFDVPE